MTSKNSELSACCQAPIKATHGCDDDLLHGGKKCTCEIVTSWYECEKCKKPCDVYVPYESVRRLPKQNKPEWLENHFCRFNDGEHSCECFVDGYKAGVKAARADQTMFHSCLCGKMPTPEEQAKALAELDSVKFLMKAEHERGKKEGAMIAFNLIDDSAPKFEEEAKKTDDGETWLLARSLRRVRKWLNLELPKHLTKPSSD